MNTEAMIHFLLIHNTNKLGNIRNCIIIPFGCRKSITATKGIMYKPGLLSILLNPQTNLWFLYYQALIIWVGGIRLVGVEINLYNETFSRMKLNN